MTKPLESFLSELVATEPGHKLPARTGMSRLSGLDAEDAARVADAWPRIAPDVRYTLVTTLAEVAEADFAMDFGAVFRTALNDPDARVRAVAVTGLDEDEDARLAPRLAALLDSDPSADVRAVVASSLGRFVLLGVLQKVRERVFRTAYDSLLAAYRRPGEPLEVRRRALESIAYVNNETVTEMIREGYAAPEEKMRVSAVFAMGRNSEACWAQQVQRELNDANPEMRYEASRACGEMALQEAATVLAELTDDVDAEVRDAAIWALGQVGGPVARRTLERCARSDDEAVQEAAEEALAEYRFLHGDLDTMFEIDLSDVSDD